MRVLRLSQPEIRLHISINSMSISAVPARRRVASYGATEMIALDDYFKPANALDRSKWMSRR